MEGLPGKNGDDGDMGEYLATWLAGYLSTFLPVVLDSIGCNVQEK